MNPRLLQSHLSLLLLIATTSFTVQAQWVTTGTNVNTTGKVGIGFASAPNANLDINGTGANTTMNLFSGASDKYSTLIFGRQIAEGRISIASIAGNFSTDAIAGDMVIRTEGGGRKILFNTNTGSAASTLAISGNSVGIGILVPQARFHVSGGDAIVEGNTTIGGMTAFNSKISFMEGGTDNSDPLWMTRNNVSLNVTELRVNIGDNPTGTGVDWFSIGSSPSGTWTPAFIVRTDSKVGINTPSPVALLDVQYTDATTNLYRATDANGQKRWRVDQYFDMFLTNSSGTDIVKIGQGTSYFNSGNIGIGTNIPGALLDIADNTIPGTRLINVGNDTYLTDIDLVNQLGVYGQQDNTQGGVKLGSGGALIYGKGGNLGIGTTNPANDLHIDPLAAGGITIGKNSDGTGGSTGYTALVMNISQYQNGYASIQSIAQSGISYGNLVLNAGGGNVGIGTGIVAPVATLEINGTFKVSGETKFTSLVHAREFRVCTDPNSACPPDYVFEKDYQLRSLEEVEKYIMTNKHLPEVASAEQMVQNGVGMMEMNMTLLKKVEELTLYVIELKKDISLLKSANRNPLPANK